MADEEQEIPSAAAGVGGTVEALNRADLEAALRTAQEEAAAATLRASALEKTNTALSSRLRRVLRTKATPVNITSPGEAPDGSNDVEGVVEDNSSTKEEDALLDGGDDEDEIDVSDETSMLRGLLAAREADLKAAREEIRDIQEAYKSVVARLRRYEGEHSESEDEDGSHAEMYAQERQRQAELVGQVLEAPAAFAATFREFLASSASGINQASTSLASAVFGEELDDENTADASAKQNSKASTNVGSGFGLMKMLSKSEVLNEVPPRKQQ